MRSLDHWIKSLRRKGAIHFVHVFQNSRSENLVQSNYLSNSCPSPVGVNLVQNVANSLSFSWEKLARKLHGCEGMYPSRRQKRACNAPFVRARIAGCENNFLVLHFALSVNIIIKRKCISDGARRALHKIIIIWVGWCTWSFSHTYMHIIKHL